VVPFFLADRIVIATIGSFQRSGEWLLFGVHGLSCQGLEMWVQCSMDALQGGHGVALQGIPAGAISL
jgi:hypothetical protein